MCCRKLVVPGNLTGNQCCRKMSPIPRHVTDQRLKEQSVRNLEHLHFPMTKATADLHWPMITREGGRCGSNESQWGQRALRQLSPLASAPLQLQRAPLQRALRQLSQLQPAGLHREASSYSATKVRACVVQNCAKLTPLPPSLPLFPTTG